MDLPPFEIATDTVTLNPSEAHLPPDKRLFRIFLRAAVFRIR
jgi:hypothetical protein